MTEVPDPVFSGIMLGPGVGVLPAPDISGGPAQIVSPVDGVVVKAMNHAAIVESGGVNYLVHAGIDTAPLEGALECLCAVGQQVSVGDPLLAMDVESVMAAGLSPHVLVVLVQAPADGFSVTAIPGAQVDAGDPIATYAG